MGNRRALQMKFVALAAKDNVLTRFSKDGLSLRTTLSRHEFKSTTVLLGDTLYLNAYALHGSVPTPSVLQLHLRYWCEYAGLMDFSIIDICPSTAFIAHQALPNLTWNLHRSENEILLYKDEEALNRILDARSRIKNWISSFMERESLAHISWDPSGGFRILWHGAQVIFTLSLSKSEIAITCTKDSHWKSVAFSLEQLEDALESTLSTVKSKFRLQNLMNPTFVHFHQFFVLLSRSEELMGRVLKHLQINGYTDENIEKVAILEMRKGTPRNLYETLYQDFFCLGFRFGDAYIHVSAFNETADNFDIHINSDKGVWIAANAKIFGSYIEKSLAILLQND